MATTLGVKNIGAPAPKWFRTTKRIIYLLAASSIFTGTLSRFEITTDDQQLITGWMLLVGEILTMLLGNTDTDSE
jgi:hypothetical protein